jgi:hypothetical protein
VPFCGLAELFTVKVALLILVSVEVTLTPFIDPAILSGARDTVIFDATLDIAIFMAVFGIADESVFISESLFFPQDAANVQKSTAAIITKVLFFMG